MSKHEKTLKAIKSSTLSANIRWSDVESLMVWLGATVKERKGSAISVSFNGMTASFHRPHPSDKADRGAVASALAFMVRSGMI